MEAPDRPSLDPYNVHQQLFTISRSLLSHPVLPAVLSALKLCPLTCIEHPWIGSAADTTSTCPRRFCWRKRRRLPVASRSRVARRRQIRTPPCFAWAPDADLAGLVASARVWAPHGTEGMRSHRQTDPGPAADRLPPLPRSSRSRAWKWRPTAAAGAERQWAVRTCEKAAPSTHLREIEKGMSRSCLTA